jgi:hypothetical protein
MKWLFAAIILGLIVEEYVRCRSHGFWPIGHPWAPLALSAIAITQLLPATNRRARLVVTACGLLSCVLWLWSVHR